MLYFEDMRELIDFAFEVLNLDVVTEGENCFTLQDNEIGEKSVEMTKDELEDELKQRWDNLKDCLDNGIINDHKEVYTKIDLPNEIIMRNVCVSVAQLYEQYGDSLVYCDIEVEKDGYEQYYDIIDNGVVCMDGEVCEVISEDEYRVELLNCNGEVYRKFTLTREEFEVATFVFV